MVSDIVARLRNCDCIPHCLCAEAADKIDRLCDELAEARQIIFRLQTSAACCRTSPAATTRDGEEPFISEAL